MDHFGATLRTERAARGLSQQSLAFEAEISPRHLSFLETGRSAPSRSMVERLADALDLPLRRRNTLFETAGFSAPHKSRALDAPAMAAINAAIDRMLSAQTPFPALAMTSDWRLERSNKPHQVLLSALGAQAERGLDLLALLLQPGEVRSMIANWSDVASHALQRAQRDAADPARRAELKALAAQAGLSRLHLDDRLYGDSPVMPVCMRFGEHQLNWITTVTSFGAASDLTASELLIEFFHPADEETEQRVRTLFA